MNKDMMNEDDLIKLIDSFMTSGGSFMKPQVDEQGKTSFLISNDGEKIEDNPFSVEDVERTIAENSCQLFTGKPVGNCPTCADIPNITDIDGE